MSTLTIRNLEPETKEQLRRRAVRHGQSMQNEARTILRAALADAEPVDPVLKTGGDLYALIRSVVEPIGGIDIELPPREMVREPPSFD